MTVSVKGFRQCRSQRAISRRVVGGMGASVLAIAVLPGCAVTDYRDPGLQIGSAVSQNIFVNANQFGNRRVKLRLRNSSGDPGVDVARMRSDVDAGLRGAGYSTVEDGFGILIDVNLYFLNSVAVGRARASNEVGALLGGVAGYELARGSRGISAGSGAVIGAIAGASLQDVLRTHSDYDSYLAVCDVNIGIVRQQTRERDSFVIGGNRFERESTSADPTFESFAQRQTLKVYVYAGARRGRRDEVMWAIQDRLARVVSNLM